MEAKDRRYLSGCCNQKVSCHLPVACRQKSDAVGLGEFLKNESILSSLSKVKMIYKRTILDSFTL